jgi:hypothetical protein
MAAANASLGVCFDHWKIADAIAARLVNVNLSRSWGLEGSVFEDKVEVVDCAVMGSNTKLMENMRVLLSL